MKFPKIPFRVGAYLFWSKLQRIGRAVEPDVKVETLVNSDNIEDTVSLHLRNFDTSVTLKPASTILKRVETLIRDH